jgi:hypothetical protein
VGYNDDIDMVVRHKKNDKKLIEGQPFYPCAPHDLGSLCIIELEGRKLKEDDLFWRKCK